MRDLMGEENYYWQGTPMFVLFQKHEKSCSDPVKMAGKESGWLLKRVINNDKIG